jgi:hypothetical protein
MDDTNSKPAPPQFTLRGMLWFVVAWSAYFAQFAAIRESQMAASDWEGFSWHLFFREDVSCRFLITIIVSWILVGAFYLRMADRKMIVAHCAGPLMATPFMIGALLSPALLGFSEMLFHAIQVFAFSGFASTTAGLPAIVVIMVKDTFQRRRG